ncbi:MAG: hypothetical protein AB1758_20945, partial [Candidatus Eremiobacterota bacterium]
MEFPYTSPEAIGELLRLWSDTTLPFQRWRHTEHLVVALWHTLRYPAPEALDRVRAGIQRYNLAHGVVQTPERGYHETLTRYWMHRVGRFAETHPGLSEPELAERLCR